MNGRKARALRQIEMQQAAGQQIEDLVSSLPDTAMDPVQWVEAHHVPQQSAGLALVERVKERLSLAENAPQLTVEASYDVERPEILMVTVKGPKLFDPIATGFLALVENEVANTLTPA